MTGRPSRSGGCVANINHSWLWSSRWSSHCRTSCSFKSAVAAGCKFRLVTSTIPVAVRSEARPNCELRLCCRHHRRLHASDGSLRQVHVERLVAGGKRHLAQTLELLCSAARVIVSPRESSQNLPVCHQRKSRLQVVEHRGLLTHVLSRRWRGGGRLRRRLGRGCSHVSGRWLWAGGRVRHRLRGSWRRARRRLLVLSTRQRGLHSHLTQVCIQVCMHGRVPYGDAAGVESRGVRVLPPRHRQ